MRAHRRLVAALVVGVLVGFARTPAVGKTYEEHRPHFHAYYQDEVGIFAVDAIELIGGSLPSRQRRLVEA